MEVSLPQSKLPHRPSSTKIAHSQPKPAGTLTKSEQLWREAYRTMKERELALAQNYEKNLSPEATTFTSPDQIQDAVKASLDDRETHQIIITLAGKSVKVREYGEKLVKFTLWSKDWISSAVSAEPYAALAWAGISLLLPLVLGPSQESDAMLRGLDSISHLIQLYKIRETLYLNTSDQTGFEEAVIQLYSYIFEYQARMLCHLSRKSVTRAFQSIIKAGQWDDLLRMTREWDGRCLSYSGLIDLKLERKQWDRQILHMDQSRHIQQRIVDELKMIQLQRAKECDDGLHREFFHDFSSRYSEDKDFNPPRVPDTCQWFLENAKFHDWRNSESFCILWVSAGPGCGKSVLSKCLVDEILVSHRAMTSTICYFFFKDGQEGRQTGADALTAILHQLYSSNPQSSLIRYALDKFRIHGKSLCGMFGELWRILTETAKDPAAGEIICVVDALDECTQVARERFLDELIDFYSRCADHNNVNICLKFLITGRPYDSIQSRFDELSGTISYTHIDADNNHDSIGQDINKMIDQNIPRILGRKFNHDDQKQIADHLKASEDRTYLWLYFIFDVMKAKAAIYGTTKKMSSLIGELPSSVSAAYEQILSKSDAPLARTALQIILASRRPLTVSEMNVAFEIATGDAKTSYADLDRQSEDTFKSSLREICGLFVTIHDSQVYLIHQTAKEFLLTKPGLSRPHNALSGAAPKWEHTINVDDAETLMAKVCMSLLWFKEFSVVPKWGHDTREFGWDWEDIYWDEIHSFVLLEYASINWAVHYAAIQKSTDHALSTLALMLCENERTAFRACYPIFRIDRQSKIDFYQHKITILCELGLHILVEQSLMESLCIDADNFHLNAGLLTASEGGHEKVVQMLLDAGADVNALGEGYYGSALLTASEGGYEKVVQMLLDAGADVNVRGYRNNALQAASKNGHGKVVQMLLDAGADVNVRGYRNNALQAASKDGHEKVVQMLLDAGADVNAQGGYCASSALQAASEGDHKKVVQLLLAAGAEDQ